MGEEQKGVYADYVCSPSGDEEDNPVVITREDFDRAKSLVERTFNVGGAGGLYINAGGSLNVTIREEESGRKFMTFYGNAFDSVRELAEECGLEFRPRPL